MFLVNGRLMEKAVLTLPRDFNISTKDAEVFLAWTTVEVFKYMHFQAQNRLRAAASNTHELSRAPDFYPE
ncbi:unnamed protein product [Discula destructiva]